MACKESEIIGNIVSQLRAMELFARVSDSEVDADSAVPAVGVLSRGWQDVSADGLAGKFERFYSMPIDIVIATRVSGSGQGNARLLELANSVADVLLDDPTRGGECCNLPTGKKATIIEKLELNEKRHGNRSEVIMRIACHYRQVAAESFSGATIDGESLFSSGPSEIIAGSWERETVRRSLAGLDGEISLDMGQRSRLIVQRGILSAETSAALLEIISLIQSKEDGVSHELIDSAGGVYADVLIESFEQISDIIDCDVVRCEYEIKYRQLR